MAKDSISETVRNHKKGARWTEEEVFKAFDELGFTLDQSFSGSVSDKHYVIYPNGDRKYVKILPILRGESAARRIQHTTETVNEEIGKYGAVLMEPFKGSVNKRHLVKFINGQVKNTLLLLVISGKVVGKKHSTQTINKKLSEQRAELIGEFNGSVNRKHWIRFECGHEHEMLLSNIFSSRSCPLCGSNGFKYGQPGFLYLIEVYFQHSRLYKIGITNQSVERRYKQEDADYKIISLFRSDMGRNVANAEKSLLKEFSRYKYDGESPFRTTKTREIFTQDISTELRFWEIVNFNE